MWDLKNCIRSTSRICCPNYNHQHHRQNQRRHNSNPSTQNRNRQRALWDWGQPGLQRKSPSSRAMFRETFSLFFSSLLLRIREGRRNQLIQAGLESLLLGHQPSPARSMFCCCSYQRCLSFLDNPSQISGSKSTSLCFHTLFGSNGLLKVYNDKPLYLNMQISGFELTEIQISVSWLLG